LEFVIDVLGQTIDPISRVEQKQKLPNCGHLIFQKNADLIYTAVEA
jgi:hypothetical protein